MSERVRVETEVPEGGAVTVEAFGHAVAVFRSDGCLYALDDTCPHRGAPLSKGTVEAGVVECPLHGWRFRLADGVMEENDGVRQRRFGVEVDGGVVYVRGPE